MTKYAQYIDPNKTPHSEPIPGREARMYQTESGGYNFVAGDWERLRRFLILGTDGGTYYTSERKLTVENAQVVARCLKEDGRRVVDLIVEVSDRGLAPKNDAAVFSMAMAISPQYADVETRRYAAEQLPKVCRIGTDLFSFNDQANTLRGGGKLLRLANQNWYNSLRGENLAYQLVKYKQRGGWSHYDVLNTAHPEGATETHKQLFHWVVSKHALGKGWIDQEEFNTRFSWNEDTYESWQRLLWLDSVLPGITELPQMLELIRQFNPPWEMLPSKWLAKREVWRALLPHLPYRATRRNLPRMTMNGLVDSFSPETWDVVNRLTNQDHIRKAREHPFEILKALVTYQAGHSVKGDSTWAPVGAIIDALDRAFYMAFETVEPTGKRLLVAIDSSGSMWSPVNGIPFITAAEASAALASVIGAVEPAVHFTHFTTSISPLPISTRQRADDIIRTLGRLRSGNGTACSLPFRYAAENRLLVDAFIILTDNQSWFGDHPSTALNEYRRKYNEQARAVAVAMAANNSSILNPEDPLSLNIVGMSPDVPTLINDFIRGEV